MPRARSREGETAEEASARKQREKEAREAADQLKAQKRSSSRDVKMNERCRGSTGTGRTITSLLGLDTLLPAALGGAAPTAAALKDQDVQEDLLFPFEKDGLKIILACRRDDDGSCTIRA